MMTKEQWIALRPKRAAITAALEAVGIPIIAWCNEVPEFKAGYEPDWAEVEIIATTLKGLSDVPKMQVKKRRQKKAVK